MYNNIGNKLKILARFIFILESIVSFFAACAIYVTVNSLGLTLIIMIFGPIIAWISSWTLYAFGELVEDVSVIRQSFKQEKNSLQDSSATTAFEIISTPPKQSNTTEIFCEVCGADVTSDNLVCHVCKNKIK